AADAIVAVGTGVAGMREYRNDIRARATAAGRNPDDIKLMFCVSPVVAPTEEEARAEVQRLVSTDSYIEKQLVGISSNTEIDFKQ
ncbi:FMNH2-dependent monooxygenase, partial [Mycobacterium sp. ITM-2017-0098]